RAGWSPEGIAREDPRDPRSPPRPHHAPPTTGIEHVRIDPGDGPGTVRNTASRAAPGEVHGRAPSTADDDGTPNAICEHIAYWSWPSRVLGIVKVDLYRAIGGTDGDGRPGRGRHAGRRDEKIYAGGRMAGPGGR